MIAILSLAISLGYIVGGSSFQQNLVLDGVSLPVDWSSSVNYFPALTKESALVTAQFLGNNTATFSSIVGKKKTDPQTKKIFEGLHKTYVDFTIEPNLPDGYLYFGNGDDLKNLPYMLKTNAFFMAAVRSGPNKTFEIDPFGYRGSTYFSQLTACLKNTVPRVSATLDPFLNVLKLKVFNSSDPTTELTGYSQEQAATYLLYQISYFAQNVHASTHIYHLIMSSAMMHATTNTSLNSWAKPYMFQVYFKYMQVETIILSAAGFLTGSAPYSSGYNAQDRAKILSINKAMLCEWGQYKTADQYVKRFLFKNISPRSQALCVSGMGKSFLRQVGLIAPFAKDMDAEFKKDPNYKTITSNLESYLQQTGTGVSSVDSMKSWLELMSVTGVLHGSTFSMSRLSLTHNMISVNSAESETFTVRDATLTKVLTVTILGTHEEFYVFSDHLPATNPYNINTVLQAYDKKTTALKEVWQKEITKDPAVYNTYGWILSDHGPNFKDGKQLTLVTYF